MIRRTLLIVLTLIFLLPLSAQAFELKHLKTFEGARRGAEIRGDLA